MKYEVYLEIENLDDDQIDALTTLLKRPVDADDELTCEASFDVDGADPSVGIMTSQVDVYAVNFTDDFNKERGENPPTFDVTDFFDLEKVANQIEEDADSWSMKGL